MPSRKSSHRASKPAAPSGEVPPEVDGGGREAAVDRVLSRLEALERDSSDTREAVQVILAHLKATPRDAPQTPARPAPGQRPGPVTFQPGPGVPPVALTPFGPQQTGAQAYPQDAGAPQDIPPGMMHLLELAQSVFAPGTTAGSGAIEKRLIEASLGILDAKLSSAKSEAGIMDLVAKRVASKLGEGVASDISRSFE